MSFLSVTNWSRYQHYGDRTPIWIKFYVESLHDEKLRSLPLSTRLLWDQMLLLAAMFQNAVPNSPEVIGNLVSIPPETCREGIATLLKMRLLREKTSRRSASKQSLAQKRREEKRLDSARAKAVKEAAEKYVRSEAQVVGDDVLKRRLVSEYGLDDVAVQRLLGVAAEAREVA